MENAMKAFKTETGKCVVSIILGFGLASIFRKSCESRNCLLFKGPPFLDIQENVYKYDDKCYKFSEKAVKCDPQTNKQVTFA